MPYQGSDGWALSDASDSPTSAAEDIGGADRLVPEFAVLPRRR